MNSLILHKVQGFLDRVSREGTGLDPKLVKEFTEACTTSVIRQFSNKRGDWKPRMSSLGRPLCQQKMERDGAEKNFEYNSLVRFMFGDLVEAIAILVMKSAGVDIEAEQKAVKLQLGKHSVSGTLDVEIDGKVWDIKSASPYAFEQKFGQMGGYKKIKEDDVFGYVSQGYLYSKSREKFKRCFTDKEETYKDKDKNVKKTGNRVLSSICGFCDFKRTCWPDAIMHRKVGSTARFPKSVWYSKLKKREI